MPTDPRVDDYIARQAEFAQPILRELRSRVHELCPDITETIKWGMPFFVHDGHLLANMAAFKAHASFGFWRGSVINADAKEDGMGHLGKLRSVSDLPNAAMFTELVRAAVALIDTGQGKMKRAGKPPKDELPVPELLAVALAADPAAAATFDNFPPSCRREYCEWIADAKREETRARRVSEAIEWMRAGKRRHWKYENC